MSESAAWRKSTEAEIRGYYRDTFPEYLEQLPSHITALGPKEYALSFRGPYPVVGDDKRPRDFIRRSTWHTDSGDKIRSTIQDMDDIVSFIQAPAVNDPLKGSNVGLADPSLVESSPPVPEAVYYALDNWERNWVLMVDIDAKDIAEKRAEEMAGEDAPDSRSALLEQTGFLSVPPEGYKYTFEDVLAAIDYGFEVEQIFEEKLGADNTLVVYTGQGVHVYLLDIGDLYQYDVAARKAITKLLQHRHDIPIDAPVTTDPKRVARLPYSLHSEVSRIVTPIWSSDFDPRNQALPPFLEQRVSP